MASKMIFKEIEGEGLQLDGALHGNLPGILRFTEAVVRGTLEEIHHAAMSFDPKPGLDPDAVGVALAIEVVKNAFNTFMEDHEDSAEEALRLSEHAADTLSRMKGAM